MASRRATSQHKANRHTRLSGSQQEASRQPRQNDGRQQITTITWRADKASHQAANQHEAGRQTTNEWPKRWTPNIWLPLLGEPMRQAAKRRANTRQVVKRPASEDTQRQAATRGVATDKKKQNRRSPTHGDHHVASPTGQATEPQANARVRASHGCSNTHRITACTSHPWLTTYPRAIQPQM